MRRFGAARAKLELTTEENEERALLDRVRAGDREAFGTLVDRHIARAMALALRVLHHREDAEDLVQDAFIAALEHFEAFDASRRFWPWFARILVNRGLDRASALAVRHTLPLPEDIAQDAATPHELAERREMMERFRHELALLPPRQQLVMKLFEVDGYSIGEISELIGSSTTAVRWNLHAGRQRLRSVLSAFTEGGA